MFPDWIHKLVTFLTTPMTVGMLLIFTGLAVSRLVPKKQLSRFSKSLVVFSFVWLWLWSTPLITWLLGVSLEKLYLQQTVEEMPTADIIAILGGGMWADTNVVTYADMSGSADRVWHGARLYKAGKAPKISLTGPSVRLSTTPLLLDLGIPASALVYFEDGKNTEDEARMIANAGFKKVLLVTSAWHMRRAQWLFEREGLEVVPAATDYTATMSTGADVQIMPSLFIPRAECLSANSAYFKEHFAYWCYRFIEGNRK